MAKKKIAAILSLLVLTTIAAGGVYAYLCRDRVASIWDKSSHWIQAKLGKDVEHVMDDDSVVIVDSTCTGKGSKTWKCKICGAETVEEIEAKGHNIQVHREESTCTSLGHMYEYCVDCDYQTGSVDLNPVPHTYALVEEIAATCTEDGKMIYECSGCGGTKEETVAALGHDYNADDKCTRCGFVWLHTLLVCPDTSHLTFASESITFNGTGIAILATKDTFDNFEMTFTINEVNDVRGAMQLGIGAPTVDSEIMSVPYVQFNYDRPVVIDAAGKTYDYWTNGQDWTIRVEDGKLTLSCENGVICENLDIGAGAGHLILRAENSCSLSLLNLKIEAI